MFGRRYIRIIATPPGEAPQQVREAWVGVRLPLPFLVTKSKAWRSAGVMTGPRTLVEKFSALWSGKLERKPGYAVRVMDAMTALEQVHPEAASWWRQNTPHLLRPGKCFVFAADVCIEERDPGAD